MTKTANKQTAKKPVPKKASTGKSKKPGVTQNKVETVQMPKVPEEAGGEIIPSLNRKPPAVSNKSDETKDLLENPIDPSTKITQDDLANKTNETGFLEDLVDSSTKTNKDGDQPPFQDSESPGGTLVATSNAADAALTFISPLTLSPKTGNTQDTVEEKMDVSEVASKPNPFANTSDNNEDDQDNDNIFADFDNVDQNVQIIVVKGNQGTIKIPGFAVVPKGKNMDRAMTAPMYAKESETDHALKQDMIARLNCVGFTFEAVREDGSVIMNDRGYPIRTIVVPSKPETLTYENIKYFVENILKTQIQTNAENYEIQIKESDFPSLPDDAMAAGTTYREVDSWDQAISLGKGGHATHLVDGLLKPIEKKKKVKIGINKYFKNNKEHIYNVFTEGKITKSIIRKYRLDAQNLRPADAALYESSKPQAGKGNSAK